MYRTKRFGLVSCKEENRILAELERDVEHKKKHKRKRRGKHHHGRSHRNDCYIEKGNEYGVERVEFDSGALISREYEPDGHVDIVLLDTKQTSFKQYGLREGDHVRVHYEKGNNGWDLGGRIDDINDTFMSVMVRRFDEIH